MGANAAGLYAGAFPERVRRFINAEGFGMADSDPSGAPANYRRWIEKREDPAAYSTFASFEDLAERIRKRSPSMPPDRARYVAGQWGRQAEDGTIVLRADPAHKLPNAVLYRRVEAMACWQAIEAEVLLVMGEQSTFGDALADWQHADPAQRPFPGAGLVVVPGAGHMLHFEKPAELAQALQAFAGTG
jgi:pimeloyl-ACP methyl ester carboxylesterase